MYNSQFSYLKITICGFHIFSTSYCCLKTLAITIAALFIIQILATLSSSKSSPPSSPISSSSRFSPPSSSSKYPFLHRNLRRPLLHRDDIFHLQAMRAEEYLCAQKDIYLRRAFSLHLFWDVIYIYLSNLIIDYYLYFDFYLYASHPSSQYLSFFNSQNQQEQSISYIVICVLLPFILFFW